MCSLCDHLVFFKPNSKETPTFPIHSWRIETPYSLNSTTGLLEQTYSCAQKLDCYWPIGVYTNQWDSHLNFPIIQERRRELQKIYDLINEDKGIFLIYKGTEEDLYNLYAANKENSNLETVPGLVWEGYPIVKYSRPSVYISSIFQYIPKKSHLWGEVVLEKVKEVPSEEPKDIPLNEYLDSFDEADYILLKFNKKTGHARSNINSVHRILTRFSIDDLFSIYEIRDDMDKAIQVAQREAKIYGDIERIIVKKKGFYALGVPLACSKEEQDETECI